MPYRIWFIASFPTPLFFRYHLPLKCLFELKESVRNRYTERMKDKTEKIFIDTIIFNTYNYMDTVVYSR